jgi:isopropylmalate/homocitrate/citramalate synthase
MRVTVCDVGPRDGLQSEPETLEPPVREELVERLARAGLPRIEAVSFVHPDRVPQMAGARSRRARPATSRPRISSTCSTARASSRASTSRR